MKMGGIKIFIYYLSILIILLDFIVGTILIIQTFKVDGFAIVSLSIKFLALISSFFTNKFLTLTYFSVMLKAQYSYPYVNILFIILDFILLIGYSGINDNYKKIHQIAVSIFLLFNSISFIILHI